MTINHLKTTKKVIRICYFNLTPPTDHGTILRRSPLRAKIMIERYHKMNPRSIWRGCSMSTSCQALPSAQVKITNNLYKDSLVFPCLLPTCSLQKLSCADTCLAEQREEMERKERERRRCEHLVNSLLLSLLLLLSLSFSIYSKI